jgi:hypothetical protein
MTQSCVYSRHCGASVVSPSGAVHGNNAVLPGQDVS